MEIIDIKRIVNDCGIWSDRVLSLPKFGEIQNLPFITLCFESKTRFLASTHKNKSLIA